MSALSEGEGGLDHDHKATKYTLTGRIAESAQVIIIEPLQ